MTDSNLDLNKFQPIEVPDIPEADYSVFDTLHEILKRIGRGNQKSHQNLDLLRDDLEQIHASFTNHVEQIRQRQNQFDNEIKSLEAGLLQLVDVIDSFHRSASSISDPAFLEAVEVAVRVKEQITAQMGIQVIPGVGAEFNTEVHYAASVETAPTPDDDQLIVKVIEEGYRRGERLLRRASVVVSKWQGE